MKVVTAKFFLMLVIAAAISPAFAASDDEEKIDAQTRDLLIGKLVKVHVGLAPSDPARVPITLRLADLYSERARLDAMQELKANCTTCVAGREDRVRAMQLYQEVLPRVPATNRGKILTQMGRMDELSGNENEAFRTYGQILRDVRDPKIRAEANLSMAEILFRRHEYAQAREKYKEVADTPTAASQGLAVYRIAWCEFNLDHVDDGIQSLVKILRTPELLNRSGSTEVVQVDEQFHEEVSRDLATFISHRSATAQDIQLVYDLSPPPAKLPNVSYMASEAERLGQSKTAIAAWGFVQTRDKKPESRLATHVHLAQLQLESHAPTEALRELQAASALWPSAAEGCSSKSEGQCGQQLKELKARMRKLVLDWHHAEKSNPSEPLFSAYEAYIQAFPEESDMMLAAAQIAQIRKNYQAELALSEAAAAAAGNEKDSSADERLEKALMVSIEASELLKSEDSRQKAYDNYLAKSRLKSKTLEVRYQKAHMLYDRAEYVPAIVKLREVALSKESGSLALKKQAADLAVDAAVLLKDDALVEKLASEFSKMMPEGSSDFAKIARKSVLNQSLLATQGSGGAGGVGAQSAGLEASWATLERFDVASASDDEKISYYKNRLILAEKLKKYGEARLAAASLLKINGLNAEDREFALSRSAWLAELNLDFDGALVDTEKMASIKPETKWLKLAMFAELSGKDPSPYYRETLKISQDEGKKALLAASLVRRSKEPRKEIDRQKASLTKKPELLARLYLEIFAAEKSARAEIAKKVAAEQTLSASASGKIILQNEMIAEVAKVRVRLKNNLINAKSQKTLTQSLKSRVALLDEADRLATRAVESGDWASEIIALDLLASEHGRFYQEVLSLPVPSGLSPEDEQQYLSLLSQTAAPHQTRADDIKKKLAELWSNPDALTHLQTSISAEDGPVRDLLEQTAANLNDIAPKDQQEKLAVILALPGQPRPKIPALAVFEKARQQVREQPENRANLTALLELERQADRKAMVGYLEGRLETLPSGGTD